MDTKEIKIIAPEGMEIDKENRHKPYKINPKI